MKYTATNILDRQWYDTVEEALEAAEDYMSYTGEAVYVEDETGLQLYYSAWWGVPHDPEDEDGPLADFGDFGFYDIWVDIEEESRRQREREKGK